MNKIYTINSNELIELRRNYGLSLDDFSKIIGCAKKTLISYEHGSSIPNDNYVVMINTLIKNPEIINYFIESNKERFTEKELTRITKKVNGYLGGKKSKINYVISNINTYNNYLFK